MSNIQILDIKAILPTKSAVSYSLDHLTAVSGVDSIIDIFHF